MGSWAQYALEYNWMELSQWPVLQIGVSLTKDHDFDDAAAYLLVDGAKQSEYTGFTTMSRCPTTRGAISGQLCRFLDHVVEARNGGIPKLNQMIFGKDLNIGRGDSTSCAAIQPLRHMGATAKKCRNAINLRYRPAAKTACHQKLPPPTLSLYDHSAPYL